MSATATPWRLLLLPRYSSKGASTRLRSLQYRPYLEGAGFDMTVHSLFDDDYLEAVYRGKGIGLGYAAYLGRRLRSLRAARSFDLVLLEKEALPFIPWWIEKGTLRGARRLVVDYDDALFHRYDMHASPIIRAMLGGKIDGVMARAEMILAGNSYLADRARAAGARRIEHVPTVVDLDLYGVTRRPSEDGRPRIGWIGTPETWQRFGQPMRAMLERVAKRHDAVIRVVGASASPERSGPFEYLPWSERDEVALLQGMDIGIMPLDDTPWSRGKCGYKLIQYMACGLPVVASPIGVNSRLAIEDVTGLLATSEAEWEAALSRLLGDPDLRARLGAAGRSLVEREYCLQVTGPRMAGLLSSLLPQGQPRR
jgi:glycosyltransferase involved in cell wall biosynthesis